MPEARQLPILFSGEMVRAILDGRKTVTRRVVKPQPPHDADIWEVWECKWKGSTTTWGPATHEHTGLWMPSRDMVATFKKPIRCPYGKPGDLLVPLTTWAVHAGLDDLKPRELPRKLVLWSYWESDRKPVRFGKLRPGRFLPKRFRHLLPRLKNTGVGVERLQEIDATDATAEGILVPIEGLPKRGWREIWQELWDSLNAKRGFGWESNPFVWVVRFAQVKEKES